MNTNKKIFTLVEHGFKPSTLMKLTDNQISMMYSRLMEQSTPQNTTASQKTVTTYKLPQNKKTMVNGLEIDNTGGQTKITPMEAEMKEEMDFIKGKKKNEVKEKSVSKQQQKFFGVVRGMQKGDIPKKGDAGKAAEEMSKKDVKDFASTKHKGLPKKKETKESYSKMIEKAMTSNILKNGVNKMVPGLDWKSSIEENVKNMVDKHITPKISKKDFVKYIREAAKDSDTKEKEITKPGTKEKEKTKPRPDTPYRPKPGPEKAPKAKKMETKENDTKTAPVKPKTPKIKPGTKPRPDTPYKPKPGPAKAPKAGKGDLPSWLTYSAIGLNIK